MQNDTCYILALIKRDDGERLLLGTGFYEFTSGQKHFNPNSFANDVVELQGTDGQLLAGQVRRSTTQTFEGYIGDGTISKQMVEQKRREFFLFFRKQHHYTAVYIMPDGTAIKRDRGYITQAPAVQELYQVQPKWSIGLAFEDVNYYSYAEDSQGNEIYSFEATLALANIADGGLISDANGAKSDSRVFIGKNIWSATTLVNGYYAFANGAMATGNTKYVTNKEKIPITGGKTYTIQADKGAGVPGSGVVFFNGSTFISSITNPTNGTFTAPNNADNIGFNFYNSTALSPSEVTHIQLEEGSTSTAWEPYSPGFTTGGYIFAPSTGGGPVVVTVNGVDNANPVWHVYGPATNPTLTNSTTGEALTWNGTVPNNQELIIDMGAQTATLEGANVFEFVSGSWVQLEPGSNRISYTAANTTKSSTVYWNEVVG